MFTNGRDLLSRYYNADEAADFKASEKVSELINKIGGLQDSNRDSVLAAAFRDAVRQLGYSDVFLLLTEAPADSDRVHYSDVDRRAFELGKGFCQPLTSAMILIDDLYYSFVCLWRRRELSASRSRCRLQKTSRVLSISII